MLPILILLIVPTSGTDDGSPCSLPVDPGPCSNYSMRYQYNPSSGVCSTFAYGGCGGNKNNFKTYEDCVSSCKYIRRENLRESPEMNVRGFILNLDDVQKNTEVLDFDSESSGSSNVVGWRNNSLELVNHSGGGPSTNNMAAAPVLGKTGLLWREFSAAADTQAEIDFSLFVRGNSGLTFHLRMEDPDTGLGMDVVNLESLDVREETWNTYRYTVPISEADVNFVIKFEIGRDSPASSTILIDNIKVRLIQLLDQPSNDDIPFLFPITTLSPPSSTTPSTSSSTSSAISSTPSTSSITSTDSSPLLSTDSASSSTNSPLNSPSTTTESQSTGDTASTSSAGSSSSELISSSSTLSVTESTISSSAATLNLSSDSSSSSTVMSSTSASSASVTSSTSTSTFATSLNTTSANELSTVTSSMTSLSSTQMSSIIMTSSTMNETNEISSTEVSSTLGTEGTTKSNSTGVVDNLIAEKEDARTGQTGTAILSCLVVVLSLSTIIIALKYYRLRRSMGDYRVANGSRQNYDNPAFNGGFGIQENYRGAS